ncbi:MAG: methylenetetrahydrofolate reductase [NAD(P)H] [Elusimicrobia bacterium]|nr:methylenetetrahydrofolate reductase [NAD(P)H] [Elusimicrobiota bacterium]
MKVKDLLKSGRPCISFEFFPPKTEEGLATLLSTIATLKELSPTFVSMTYGAGGSTRSKTVALVSRIKNQIGIEAVAHLTCVGHTKEELRSVLEELQAGGVENVLALRGDPPKGQASFTRPAGGFAYASELVEFIRENFRFSVGVAGYPEKHPEATSLEEDLQRLKGKVDRGADYVITQLFFSNADYFSFVTRLRKMGVNVPIIPGIMPVTDTEQAKRFTSLCGAKVPPGLLEKLERAGADKAAVGEIGVAHATAQCEELLRNGAPGVHFYTLNRSDATREVFRRLKLAGVVK